MNPAELAAWRKRVRDREDAKIAAERKRLASLTREHSQVAVGVPSDAVEPPGKGAGTKL